MEMIDVRRLDAESAHSLLQLHKQKPLQRKYEVEGTSNDYMPQIFLARHLELKSLQQIYNRCLQYKKLLLQLLKPFRCWRPPPPFLGPKPEMTQSGDRRLNRSDGRSGGGGWGGHRLVKVVGVRAHLRQAGQLLVMSVFDAIFVHWWLFFISRRFYLMRDFISK